jgi:uncharacterized protein YeaO (DUF488 family)
MQQPTIRLRRVYEEAASGEGTRVLVDGVWPRGLSREDVAHDHWFKELAPSSELRRWFGHDPRLWAAFKQKYRKELRAEDKREKLEELAELARTGPLTLLFGAKDTEHNQAVVLREVLDEKLQSDDSD